MENWVKEVDGNADRSGKRGSLTPSVAPSEIMEGGWIVVNSDAATKEGKNVLAMAARDDRGCIVCMASKCLSGLSADLAELAALEWAADIVEKKGWPKVIWRCDAKGILDHLNSNEEPCVWRYRHQMLLLEHKFFLYNWKLTWCPRETNVLADKIAKSSFETNLDLFFDNFSCCNVPPTASLGIFGEAPLLFSFL